MAYLLVTLYALKYTVTTPAIYFPDSAGYLNMTIFRTCGYPLFVAAHKMLFGSYFESGIIATQFILNVTGALFLIRSVRKSIELNKWLLVALYAILLFPIFLGILTANTILSEGLAYPLYLFIIGNMLLAVASKRSNYFYYALMLAFVLILVRGQFLFLIPFIIIAIILAYYKSFFKWKSVLLVLTAISIPVLSIFTDIIFHKIQHHHTVTTPLTGIQIIAIPFYISHENDYIAFESKEQQEYFKFVYARLSEKKLLSSQLTPAIDPVDFFFDNYVPICNETISVDAMNQFYHDKPIEEQFIGNDKMTSAMTLPLIKHNFKAWFRMYFGNFTKGFDTSKYFLLYVILLLLAIINFIKKEDYLSKIIILLILLPIGNSAIIALAEATIGRYTFYNNWVLFLIFFILFQDRFYSKSND